MRIVAVSWLRVDPATRPGYVLLTDPWVVTLDGGWWCLIDAGLWCDGASIPALVRPWLSPVQLLAMGCLHDWASRTGSRLQPPEGSPLGPVPVTLATATALAVAMARRAGVGALGRLAIRATLTVAAPAYWHRRPMGWRPA